MDYKLEALRYKLSTGVDFQITEQGVLKGVDFGSVSKAVFPDFITKVQVSVSQLHCKGVQELDFCGNLEYIYWNYSYSGLKKVHIKSVNTLCKECFCYNTFLEVIDIDSGVEIIEDSSFLYCMSLKYFDFSCLKLDSFKCEIGDRVFQNCLSLSELRNFENLENVKFGDYCFSECESLESLVLPDNCIFGVKCFARCNVLKHVIIKNFNYLVESGAKYLFHCCSDNLVFDIYSISADNIEKIDNVLGYSSKESSFKNVNIHKERYRG